MRVITLHPEKVLLNIDKNLPQGKGGRGIHEPVLFAEGGGGISHIALSKNRKIPWYVASSKI